MRSFDIFPIRISVLVDVGKYFCKLSFNRQMWATLLMQSKHVLCYGVEN